MIINLQTSNLFYSIQLDIIFSWIYSSLKPLALSRFSESYAS